MGKHKKQRDSKYSNGLRRVSKARQDLVKLKSKAKRWERYKNEIETKDRKGDPKRWDTTGINKRISQLKSIIDKGSTTII